MITFVLFFLTLALGITMLYETRNIVRRFPKEPAWVMYIIPALLFVAAFVFLLELIK